MRGPLEPSRVSGAGDPASVHAADPLCMLIDTTTCIGCKACEVACVEWNDLRIEPGVATRILDSYQTMPDMTPSFWNLIRFDEVPVGPDRRPLEPEPAGQGGAVKWLMRKDMCMHCAEPGCLIACPAEGAIVQYTNGIVDFQGEHCIGCGYCMTGCPFDIPKFDPATRRVHKCTMCSDRVSAGMGPACVKACPTACLEFGTKREMQARAERRAGQVRADGFTGAGVYDPPGVGGTGVIYVLHHADRPELYGGLPREPRVDPLLRLWKGPLKLAGSVLFAVSLAAAALHYLRSGRRRLPPAGAPGAGPPLPAGLDLVRYTLLERAVHWTAALSFLYLAFTGLGLFTPRLAWLLTVLGGGQTARALHPIAGCVFIAAVAVLLFKWLKDLLITPADRAWLRRARDYLAGRDDHVPPSGRFNAGQKLLFWCQVLLGVVLLASGVPLWIPEGFSQGLRLGSLVIHCAAAILAAISLVAHIYMAVFVTQGSLRAMIEGKVTEEWARHHHALWAEEERRKHAG